MTSVDQLRPRNRKLRDAVEKIGSSSIALSGFIGLVFLLILFYQIATPTLIDGEEGEIVAASEFLPVSDYILKWDNPSVDEVGVLIQDPIILELHWDDVNGSYTEQITITVTAERNIKQDIYLNEDGVDTNEVTVGKKTKFRIFSTLDVPINVHQVSGPTPAANETGFPQVNTFIIQTDSTLIFSEGVSFAELYSLMGWLLLCFMIFTFIWPSPTVILMLSRLEKYHHIVRFSAFLPFVILAFVNISMMMILASLALFYSLRMLANQLEGFHRFKQQGRSMNELGRLHHSILNFDGLLLWAKIIAFVAFFFIPIHVKIPFLTENYQDIFQPYSSGIRSAFFGTFWVMGIAMVSAIPISLGAAIYLEEYSKPTTLTRLIQALITNLAGVPSIVFGLFGLAIFVQESGFGLGFGPSILAAGLTMGVMAMPIIVLATQEAIRSVPRSIRESAYGIGCTRWQVTKDHVLPSAMPGIMTGTILAMSRIIGEAAPLLVVGAFGAVLFDPEPFAALTDGNINFTVIPIQIFAWTAEPGHEWHAMAAAASIALIAVLIALNSIAIILREYHRRRLNT